MSETPTPPAGDPEAFLGEGAAPAGPAPRPRKGASRGGPATLPGRRKGASSHERVEQIQAQQRALTAADPVARERRGRLDTRNTDRYYRGGDVSAVGAQSQADAPVPAAPAAPAGKSTRSAEVAAERRRRLDERNTDKYYANAAPKAPTKQQLQQPPRQPRRPQRGRVYGAPAAPPPAAGQGVVTLHVADPAETRAVGEQVAAAFQNGAARVVVRVAHVRGLALRMRTAVDSLATRELISEGQLRDVFLDLLPASVPETRTPDEIFGKPEDVLAAKRAAGEERPAPPPLDPEAFLKGGADDEDEQLPEAPPAQLAPEEEDEDEDEDDNDFLA